MDRTRRVFGNTLSLILVRLGGILVIFALTPYIVEQLGLEAYGLWAILGSIAWYFGLLDFGIGAAFVKYIAEYTAQGAFRRVQQVITFGLIFYLLLGLLLAPLALLVVRWLVGLLQLSSALVPIAVNGFLLVFVYFFLSNALGVFGALLNGQEQMKTTSLVTVAGQVVYAATVVGFLHLGYGIYGLVTASILQTLFTALVCYIIARRKFGPLFIHPARFEWPVLRRLFAFGGWMQITNAASVINMQSDRLVIGGFINVTSVTYYEIGNKLAMLVRAVPLAFLSALLPTASALEAAGQRDQLDRAYVRASRNLMLIYMVLAGFIVGAAIPLVRVWMGQDYPYAPLVAVLLIAGYLVNMLTGVGTTMVRAMGKPRYEAYYTLMGSTLNIVLTVILAPRFGLFGVLVGTVLGLGVSSVWFLWLFHRLRRLPWWAAQGSWLWRLCLATLGAGGSLWAVCAVIPEALLSQRIVGLGVLAGLGVLYLSGLIVLLRVTRFLEPADLQLARHVLPVRLLPLLAWRPVLYLFGALS